MKTPQHPQILFALAIVAHTGFGLVGCGSPAPTAADPETVPEASAVDPAANAKLQTEIDGAQSEVNVAAEANGIALPTGFPQELAYSGARVKLTQWSDIATGPAGSVILSTEDSVKTVTKHYRAQLQESGWSAIDMPFSATTAEGSANVLNARKENTFLVATIAAGEDDTLITLQLQPQQ